MDITLGQIFRTFPLPLSSALIAGLVCPLVGCFLFVRRTSFYGIVLPQFGAAGVAFGYVLLPWWIGTIGMGGLDVLTALESPGRITPYLLSWSILFSFGGLAFLALPAGRTGSETGRVAVGFAAASAATILLAQYSPTGAEFVEALVHGEMLAIGTAEFIALCAECAVVLLVVFLFHRDFLLVSFDPSTARVLGKRVRSFELLFAAVVGVTVSVGVMTVGPVVLFGNLVVPPLAARGLARSMTAFLVTASAIGISAGVLGLWASFRWDWPLGPAIVAAAAPALFLGWVGERLRGR